MPPHSACNMSLMCNSIPRAPPRDGCASLLRGPTNECIHRSKDQWWAACHSMLQCPILETVGWVIAACHSTRCFYFGCNIECRTNAILFGCLFVCTGFFHSCPFFFLVYLLPCQVLRTNLRRHANETTRTTLDCLQWAISEGIGEHLRLTDDKTLGSCTASCVPFGCPQRVLR